LFGLWQLWWAACEGANCPAAIPHDMRIDMTVSDSSDFKPSLGGGFASAAQNRQNNGVGSSHGQVWCYSQSIFSGCSLGVV